jgi:predicted nucleic acid-binding protein
MIVVADSGPLRYLVLIGAVHVLPPLYERVLVPQAVAAELQHPKTPAVVRAWIAQPPSWLEMRPDPPGDPALALLDPGERAAIPLALAVRAYRLLSDDLDGRAEAERRHLIVTGTVGVLADAHLTGLLDFETALAHLRSTNFYVTDQVIGRVRQRIAGAKGPV